MKISSKTAKLQVTKVTKVTKTANLQRHQRLHARITKKNHITKKNYYDISLKHYDVSKKSIIFAAKIVAMMIQIMTHTPICRQITVIAKYAKTLMGGGKSLIINHISALCSVADCFYMTLRRANAVIAVALLFCLCGCTKDYEPQPQPPSPNVGVRSIQDSTQNEGIIMTIDTTWEDTVNIEF